MNTTELVKRRVYLLDRISKWLSDRRDSHGGYAEITDGDVSALNDIISELINLKCEPDPDGDVPLEVSVVDRRKFERLSFVPIRYYTDDMSQDDLFRLIRDSWLNVNIACGTHNIVLELSRLRGC